MKKRKFADLQLHSNFSDGNKFLRLLLAIYDGNDPKGNIQEFMEQEEYPVIADIGYIANTEHNTVGHLEFLLNLALHKQTMRIEGRKFSFRHDSEQNEFLFYEKNDRDNVVRIIPAIELQTQEKHHIGGYYIDMKHPNFSDFQTELNNMARYRRERGEQMVVLFNKFFQNEEFFGDKKLDISLKFDDIAQLCMTDNVCSGHFEQLFYYTFKDLKQKNDGTYNDKMTGFFDGIKNLVRICDLKDGETDPDNPIYTFDEDKIYTLKDMTKIVRYTLLRKGSPCYVDHHQAPSTIDAIDLVRSINAVPIMLHPYEKDGVGILEDLYCNHGLVGAEVSDKTTNINNMLLIKEVRRINDDHIGLHRYNFIITEGTDVHGFYGRIAGRINGHNINSSIVYPLKQVRKIINS